MSDAERSCDEPPDQAGGHRDVCEVPYEYGSTCAFECDAGFMLSAEETSVIRCAVKTKSDGVTSFMEWDRLPSPCVGEILSCNFDSTVLDSGPGIDLYILWTSFV